MNKKTKVAAVNNVENGGKTYLEYLRAVIENLPPNCEVEVFNTPITGLSAEETSRILEAPVTQVGSPTFFSNLTGFDALISNDAFVGRFIEESTYCIFASHGSAPMPAADDYCYAPWTAYWDAILTASRAALEMAAHGLGRYRVQRRNQVIGVPGNIIRTDIRSTALCPMVPLKNPLPLRDPVERTGSPKRISVMPTSLSAIRPCASLYKSLGELIFAIHEQYPSSAITFRPYPADSRREYVARVLEVIREIPFVEIDDGSSASDEFYYKSDILITDGSTGGISFFLKTSTPPIYYVNQVEAAGDRICEDFSLLMGKHDLVAGSIGEVVARIGEISELTTASRRLLRERYVENDLYVDHDVKEVLARLVGDRAEAGRAFPGVDAKGTFVNADLAAGRTRSHS